VADPMIEARWSDWKHVTPSWRGDRCGPAPRRSNAFERIDSEETTRYRRSTTIPWIYSCFLQRSIDPCTTWVVYLQAADKSTRLASRPSSRQNSADQRASMASQRPSEPCGRPRSRPCKRTSPAQGTSCYRFPPPRVAHRPSGCGHGGTRNNNTSLRDQTWSVTPAAMAGV
jgi:hypothetical protein